MKFRKTIAIILMTLANVFILAHAVMPHHHHGDLVFFGIEQLCCTTHNDCGTETDCCLATDKEHQPHHDDCHLSQQVVRDGRSINDSFSGLQVDKFFSDSCLCILCYACNQQILEQDKVTLQKYKRYTAYTETYTSPYVGAIFGLRAPPALSLL